jgi:voltage-gated potassium channel
MCSWRSVPSSIRADDTRAVEGFDRRRLLIVVIAVAIVFAGGTIGFMAILDESWHAALYRTIVSASLTGLDTTPKGLAAEALTIGIVLCGVAIFGYLAAQLFDSIAHGIFGGAWREKKRRKMIDELHDHVIVCGYGRVGQRAAEELRHAGVPHVVLDFSEEALEAARENNDLYVDGNGADDDDLTQAGIERARAIIVASDDDADNLYITLSAKTRNPKLTVIARASSEAAEHKLRLAGADRVVTPYATAGRVMGTMVAKPHVSSFVNVLTSAAEPYLNLEEILIRRGCDAVGSTIGELDIAGRTGAYIVALRKPDGTLETRPSKDSLLEEGDVILGIGSPEEIQRLEQLFDPHEAVAS